MPNTFTETQNTGWGSRLGNSFKSILVGIILFLSSFGVLYWNEGRIDLSIIAKTAEEIQIDKNNPENDEKLISASGKVQTNASLEDNYLAAGKYLEIERKVEMFSWTERASTSSEKNLGGSETETTTYEYIKDWTENPRSSSSFKIPEEHHNPSKVLSSETKRVDRASIGSYKIHTADIKLPEKKLLKLNEQNTFLKDGWSLVSDNFLFQGKGLFQEPVIGDLRISYSAVFPEENMTIFGKLNEKNKEISNYYDERKNVNLYRLFNESRDASIQTLHAEYKSSTWILRAVGFLMMWIGLSMLFKPFHVLFDVIPFLGSVSRGLISVASFIMAFILSLITIIISMILHNIIVLVIIISGSFGFAFWYKKKHDKK
ncbi:hypothetical protein HON22_04515 [Candidatus Peregrinibacteria bacterium]|jgi:hypothetical protein|nr:hypothetical protein [Candidatus Peregrinibacteria bacterium]